MGRRTAQRTDGGARIVRRHSGAVGLLRFVQFAKRLFVRIHSAPLGRLASHEAITLRVVQTDAGGGLAAESLGHLMADVAPDRRVGAAAGVVKITSDPAVTFHLAGVAGRLPNLCGTKMRAVRVGIACALNDAELAGIIEVFETSQAGMQPNFVIDLET